MQKNMFNTTMIDVSIDKLLDRLYKIQTTLEQMKKHSKGDDVIAVDESILDALYDSDFEDSCQYSKGIERRNKLKLVAIEGGLPVKVEADDVRAKTPRHTVGGTQ